MMPLRQMLFGRANSLSPAALPSVEVDVGGRKVTVHLKRHATARRMVLRLARDGESFTLSVPKRQSQASAKAFISQSTAWIQHTLAACQERQSQMTGCLMLRGKPVRLVISEGLRGHVVHDGAAGTLTVPGGEAHAKRRLIDWLKLQATRDLQHASQAYAEKMQCRFTRLVVRDQQSRWGSCSAHGALSYSWRLVLAPPFVLDYVAAHEVAHLREMNHGPRFWRLVLTHCPHTREAKRWLKSYGHTLHHGL